jgi:hypothetical protein
VRILLVSTYELGRQPFGLASPAAWLRAEGHEVTVADLSCSPLPKMPAAEAELIAFFLPMHTATRLFLRLIDRIRALNPAAHLCGYGLYAPLNEKVLRTSGVKTVIGGEFEQGLVDLARRLAGGETFTRITQGSLARQQFLVPDRAGLPALGAYARLVTGDTTRRVGYTEASRGCRHLCRHCPVVPVYQGTFRIVQQDVVLEDIRRQVASGAQHITFGDPDFLNGPGHAMPIVDAFHREWPTLTFDVTIKIEHLLKHRALMAQLRTAGCLFVTSAVESLDDAVLEKLDKGHTRADFEEALRLMREAGLAMAPTFIPFTPWTTRESYAAFLRALVDLDLADQVAPIQLAIRLLIPEGSLLMKLPEVRGMVQPYDWKGLCYPWHNRDAKVDLSHASVQELIKREEKRVTPRIAIFRKIWDLAQAGDWRVDVPMQARATVPYLTEPWYC